MATANYARRRRNAILAAIVMALVFIIIVVVIVVAAVGGSGKNKNKGNNNPTKEPTQTTAMAVLPTIPVVTADPNETFDPTVIPDGDATPTPDGDATPTPTAPQESGTIMYVTGEGVNVRKEATTDSDKITSLSKGTAVTAYDKVGKFYSVKLSDGKLGYISTSFLSEEDPKKTEATPTAKPTATPDTSKGVTMYVTGEKVNVRKSGSSSADLITSLVKGKQVTAYNKVGDWTYIRYGNDKYGYISSKYLSDTDPTKATPTPTATAKPTSNATPTPTPTAAPTNSFTKYNVPAAVAEKVDGQTRYLNAAIGDGGFGKVGNTNYCIILTNIEINGQKRFFICYEGTDTEPTTVRITSAPTE